MSRPRYEQIAGVPCPGFLVYLGPPLLCPASWWLVLSFDCQGQPCNGLIFANLARHVTRVLPSGVVKLPAPLYHVGSTWIGKGPYFRHYFLLGPCAAVGRCRVQDLRHLVSHYPKMTLPRAHNVNL